MAEATAAGRGAIALVRLSGARALTVVRALGVSALVPRRATRVRLVHPVSGDALDEAVVTWYAAPRSYTGEDVVELATHGGRVAPARVMAACVAAGARPAYAGEFTRRAVLNGKLDLLQAEAVADLIDARTTAAQRQALAQLDGGLSRRLLALRDLVLELEALLAYDVDFPEEDDGPIERGRIAAAAESLTAALRALLETAPTGSLLRDGALVVFAGPPNAGKSSLFNALLGESRAIVTPIPGTTRDAIEAVLDRTPLPLRLVDTAGLRDTDDALERLGIDVSTRYLAQAQVVLACAPEPLALATLVSTLAGSTAGVVVPVLTKADTWPAGSAAGAGPAVPAGSAGLAVSAETGAGVSALLTAIDGALAATVEAPDADGVLVMRERHRHGLATALAELTAFAAAWRDGALPATVAAVHVHAAREALEGLIGGVDVEEVLGRVFGAFCVGK